MAIYTTIDTYTGYVWWSGEAADAADACRQSTADTGGDVDAKYVETTRREALDRGGYAVHECGIDARADGQDRSVIAAVTAAPLAGYYVRASQ